MAFRSRLLGLRISGFWDLGISGLRDLGIWVWGFKVLGLGFRVEGSGFRVKGL